MPVLQTKSFFILHITTKILPNEIHLLFYLKTITVFSNLHDG